MSNTKVTPGHVQRGGVIYIRQSTTGQVVHHKESQERQYALVERAKAMGFQGVEVIDEDLGRSGSGLVDRPGFQRLVAAVCSERVGAIFSLEASRLARNGRDWHHLIDLCALTGTLVIDSDGVYEPRMINDRLLLGLKGTMSEYELSLLRQRGLAARDSKAARGALRVQLPPGYCWDELGRVQIDPDERVVGAVRMVFRKFLELGSARQVLLWVRGEKIQLPVVRQGVGGTRIEWMLPSYHNVLLLLRNPFYAGAYAFGRTETRIRIVEGRPLKTTGHRKSQERWTVLLRDHHPGYISWEQFEANQRMLSENAHMQKRTAVKSGRGGRAVLTGLLRCGRCGRMLRVFYGSRSGRVHRYQCRGDEMRGAPRCLGIGGVRVDHAVARVILDVVAPHAVEAALAAADQVARQGEDARKAVERELEEAHYEATLASRRYEAVDPQKRLVARELEVRWEAALQRVRALKLRLAAMQVASDTQPAVDREALLRLTRDLPGVWNAAGTTTRSKERLVRVLIEEVIVDLDDTSHEVVLAVHWKGGRHTIVRVARVRSKCRNREPRPSAVEALRRMGGRWPDRELAVTLNRMRCPTEDGETWTTVRVRAMRERLGIPECDPNLAPRQTVTVDRAAHYLSISVPSVHRLIRQGILPARQAMRHAPWEIPTEALDSEVVQIGVREIVARRPRNFNVLQDTKTLRLPGL